MFALNSVVVATLFSCLALASPLHDHKRAQPYGTILYNCVGTNKVALTFDDGPWIYTGGILDKLKAANMRATFFINGDNFDSIYNYNSTVFRFIADGHQIGSHTWSHADLATLTAAGITLEMTRLEDALKAILGYFPYYMRVPYLSYSSTVLSTLGTLQYVVVDSDINPQDWKYNTPSTIATSEERFLTQLNAGGGLTEMHDVQATTNSDLVPYIISVLQSRGLTSVPVGECFGDPVANWYRTSRTGGPPVSSSSTSSSTTRSSTSSLSSTSTAISTTTRLSTTTTAVPTTSSTTRSSTITTTTRSSTTTSSGTTPTGPVSPDLSCGGTNGYVCTTGKCCSKYGWCGSTADYCDTAKGCQPAFGICGIIPPGGTSPDGKCGAANGYVCTTGKCCSKYGNCGTTADYCAVSAGCQAGYGAPCT